MDRFDAMRVILAVVDAGSLSAGSRKLNAPLPSVSRKVAELERHLGTNLLVRTSRRIQLTDAGREYVEAARRIIADLEDAERRASGEYQTPRGELTITMPVEFGLRHVLPIATAFMQEHPDITLRVMVSDRVFHLVDEQVDVAVRLGPLADSSLFATRTGEFRLLSCAAPSYLDRRGTPQHPAELPDHDGIFFGSSPMFWTYNVDGVDIVTTPKAKVIVDSAAGSLVAAVNGAGISRLFDYQLRAELQSGALVSILPQFAGPTLPIHLVYPRQGLLPLKVRAFIDWAAPRMRAACTSYDCA